ncbi:MAG: D-tyrosyl-tRNA(Tyr) deacylase [Actinomycetota bacterium]|jgi:D-tyrosyl-tRNA(Tyr) deacylase
MRIVIQRAAGAEVRVEGQITGAFTGPGLVILVGVTHDDSPEIAAKLADKAYDMRLFDPAHAESVGADLPSGSGKELSAADLGLPVLVISQFTLYANTRKGRRPTWDAAAPGDFASPLVDAFAERLLSRGVRVERGVFGADMQVTLTNDGPFTIIVDSAD